MQKSVSIALLNKEMECKMFLQSNLPDGSQIFTKPFFEADQPDFVVLKEGSKVLLIKVCEDFHDIENIKQSVKNYKNNISKKYIPTLSSSYKGRVKGYDLIQSLYWIGG